MFSHTTFQNYLLVFPQNPRKKNFCLYAAEKKKKKKRKTIGKLFELHAKAKKEMQ